MREGSKILVYVWNRQQKKMREDISYVFLVQQRTLPRQRDNSINYCVLQLLCQCKSHWPYIFFLNSHCNIVCLLVPLLCSGGMGTYKRTPLMPLLVQCKQGYLVKFYKRRTSRTYMIPWTLVILSERFSQYLQKKKDMQHL